MSNKHHNTDNYQRSCTFTPYIMAKRS